MNHFFTDETEFNTGMACSREPLSAEEEIDLSKRIMAGEAAKKALARPECLTEAERADLQHAAEDGDLAFGTLVEANIPRAYKYARKTWQKNRSGLNDLEDYRQTALQIICEAARTFDWRYGCRFGTWAHKRLSQGMIRENAMNSFQLRIPEDLLSHLAELKRLVETEGIAKAAKDLNMSRKAVEKLLQAVSPDKSLNDPISSEDPDTERGEMIPDATAMTTREIDDMIDLEANIKRLQKAMAMLPTDQCELLRKRNGFDGEPLTLQQMTGPEYGKTTGGVQKREAKAVKNLRKNFDDLPLAG